eukprot:m.10298 g.10298  ORF g.10298 m.10298 type:complete len:999 (-) comp4237_c0_seq2:64-3060(-)
MAPQPLRFKDVNPEEKQGIVDQFMEDLTNAAQWCPQANTLLEIINSERLIHVNPYSACPFEGVSPASITSYRGIAQSLLPALGGVGALLLSWSGHFSDNTRLLQTVAALSMGTSLMLLGNNKETPNAKATGGHNGKQDTSSLYIMMVVGHSDWVLEKLGKDYGFPRGFPIVWAPGNTLQMFGFRPKFANYDRMASSVMPPNLQGIGCFKKWSGYLGQLLVFRYQNQNYWTATSKNGACSSFVDDAIRLFQPFVTDKLLKDMATEQLHLCAEMMSCKDQGHGARVGNETPVVTSLGKGVHLDLKTKLCKAPATGFVEFTGFKDTITYCRKFRLPVDSAILATGDAARSLYQLLNSAKDSITDTQLENILRDLGKKFSKGEFQLIKGTVKHENVLGNTLEGLVLHEYLADSEVKPENIVAGIENGLTEIVKFKFPAYTVRTMCIRTAIDHKTSLEKFGPFVDSWAKRWCASPEGRTKWTKFAWECMLLLLHDKRADLVANDEDECKVGTHIQLADQVIEHGPRLDIDETIQLYIGNNISLSRNIVVIVPFSKISLLTAVRETLEKCGITVAVGNVRPPKHKCFAKLATMYMPNKPNDDCLTYEMPLPPKESLLEWQQQKIASWPADRNTIKVSDLDDLLAKIRSTPSQPSGPKLAVDPAVEERLRRGCERSLVELLKMMQTAPTPMVIMLIGPQCIGKSTICGGLSKEGAVICSADTHMKKLGGFFPKQLGFCHEACQMDVLKAISNGLHAVVDNTNMSAAHRTLYQVIAQTYGARALSYVVCAEQWLVCDVETRTKTIDTLTQRAFRRYEKGSGEFEISRKVIAGTIKRGVDEVSSNPLTEWTGSYPWPKYQGGFCEHRGALIFRSRDTTDWAKNILKTGSPSKLPDIRYGVIRHAIIRGLGEYHITILSPHERKKCPSKPSNALPKGCESEIDIVGVGRAVIKEDDGEKWVVFGVVNWPSAAEFRSQLGLPKLDFHITLAFSNMDLHGIPKDASTLIS